MCIFTGIEKWLPALAIATSWGVTYLQYKATSVPWPSAAPEAWQWDRQEGQDRGWGCNPQVPGEHWPRSINSAATTIPLWKALTKTSGPWIFRSRWLLGTKRKTFIFLFPILRKSLEVCSYHPYWTHDLKYFSLVRPSWKLPWNRSSWIQASLGSSAEFAMVMQECQWMKPS